MFILINGFIYISVVFVTVPTGTQILTGHKLITWLFNKYQRINKLFFHLFTQQSNVSNVSPISYLLTKTKTGQGQGKPVMTKKKRPKPRKMAKTKEKQPSKRENGQDQGKTAKTKEKQPAPRKIQQRPRKNGKDHSLILQYERTTMQAGHKRISNTTSLTQTEICLVLEL